MGMDIIILAAIAIVIFFKLISQFGKVDEDQKIHFSHVFSRK